MRKATVRPEGVTLRGGTLQFGAKGVRLTANNLLDGVSVLTADDEIAILNDTSVPIMGLLTLRGHVTATGRERAMVAPSWCHTCAQARSTQTGAFRRGPVIAKQSDGHGLFGERGGPLVSSEACR
jgi:hypothetical protein